MVFHRKREILDPKVVIDDQPIKTISTVKFLCVNDDEKLPWSDHMSNIRNFFIWNLVINPSAFWFVLQFIHISEV